MPDHSKEFELSAGTYLPTDLAIVGGFGAVVRDDTGKEYIDCVAGHGTANVGHGNKFVAEAVSKAWQDYAFATSRHPHPVREQFLAKLAEKMPTNINKFFLSNSGAEAVETALKFARLATGRSKILAAKRSFHGRTLGALSVTWKPEFRAPFEPLLPDCDFFAFNKVETLAEKISDQTAAVILEIVQGESGVYVGEQEFFTKVRELCDKNGTLLIIDEVQTGVGRTGKFLALEHFDIKPDMVVLAKALAGGYPIGVTALRHDLFKDPPRGMHASTFGGNIPACAAGLAVLEFLEKEKLIEQAQKKGEILKSELEKIIALGRQENFFEIKEVRGIGLMLAVEFKVPKDSYPSSNGGLSSSVPPQNPATHICMKLKEEGVLVLQTGPKTIRLLPPLVITDEQLKEVVEKLKEALGT